MIGHFVAMGAAAALLAACVGSHSATLPHVAPEAERLFHADPRWLGGDAAISVGLGGDRVLWLFGDSFVDPAAPYRRDEASFPRNTVAIETGRDPRTARMAFAWRSDAKSAPASFFPDAGGDWFWPGGGLMLDDGTLALFLQRVSVAPGLGALGFKVSGYALVLVANPQDAPSAWRMRRFNGPALPFDAVPGAALLRDRGDIVALAPRASDHAGLLVRYRETALARGDLNGGLWWSGEARGWLPASQIGPSGPATVIPDAGAEASLAFDTCARRYVLTSSRGFGASDIVRRTAPALTGLWSAPETIFRPPESDGASPFVYAGRAHPELSSDARTSLLTYVPSSLTPNDLLRAPGSETLYWPRVALAATLACGP